MCATRFVGSGRAGHKRSSTPFVRSARSNAGPKGTEPRERETFENLPSGMRDAPNTRKVYSLGLALAEECPGNDCKVYLNIFNMARELDEALDKVKPNSAPFLALRSALMQRARELGEMYFENYAVQQFKEGMQP